MTGGWAGAAIALAIVAAPASACAKAPDIASCPRPEQPDGGEIERTDPLPVPAALRGVLASGRYHYAVAALGGGTICIDTSWTENVDGVALTPDGRFLTYRWYGYETYGYVLVDRAGAGAVHEIGAEPVFSPSRSQFAAVDQTESEFGTLSGLKVWRLDASGVSEAGKVEDIPRMNDWRIDGWTGEACIELSALPQNRTPEDPQLWKRAPRDRFVARPGRGGWTLASSRTGCQSR